MNVLSLFDGISCGRVALDRAGVKYNRYYASEIDKYAIKIAMKNFPDTIQLGDVREVSASKLPKIDLLIGGSPCQGFSFAGKQLNFDDPRSKLFFEFVRLLKECKPKYFLLENVRMKKEYQDVISEQLGVTPIMINSALVSAQNRVRLYWTNIPGVKQPEDKGIVVLDILENSIDSKYILSDKLLNGFKRKRERRKHLNSGFDKLNIVDVNKKCSTLTARYYKMSMSDPYIKCEKVLAARIVGRRLKNGVRADYDKSIALKQRVEINNNPDKTNNLSTVQKDNVILHDYCVRKLTPIECERLQTLPDNYTEGVSNTQRYKALGNGWTVDIIAHIFKGLKNE